MTQPGARAVIQGAVANARDVIGGALTNIMGDSATMNGDQTLERYITLHRGNPVAMGEFIAQHIQNNPDVKGRNPFDLMREYEIAMERKALAAGVPRGRPSTWRNDQ